MKIVFQSAVVVAVLALFLFAAPSTYANNCASNVTGNWSAPATWSTCGNGIPTAADAVKINGSFTVTVDVSNAVAASIQVGSVPTSGSCTLLFNSGSQLTVTGNVTLGGSSTTTNGTINMTNGGKLIAGSLVLGAGVNTKIWTPGTGTIELTATNTIPATIFTSFNNLTVNGGTTTLGAALTVTGNLTVTSGALSANNFNLGVAGNWINNASATAFTAGTNTVTFNSATAQTVGGTFATAFNNLTIANTASTVTLSANTSTTGNLSVSTGTFDLAAFTANRVTAGGTLTVSNNATLKIGGTNTFPTNYTTNTLVVASTVEYSGTNQTVANQTYGNLKVSSSSGAAAKTFPATALTVVGNLSSVLGAGTSVSFTAASIITVNGNVSLGASTTFNGGSYAHSIGGNWANSGTFNGNTGTVTFTGPGAAVSGSGAQNFNNLTVAASAVTFSNGSLTLSGNLATTGSGSFGQAAGGTLLMTGAGTTISGSGITLDNLSVTGSVSTTASLLLTGNLSVSGTFSASAGTITMSGAAKFIVGAGTKSFAVLSVTGSLTTDASFSIGSTLTVSGSFSASAGTATFTGTSTLSGTANLFNTTINGTSLQLSTHSILGIAGVLTLTSGTLNVTSGVPNTVNFNGSGAQNINGIPYNSLLLSNGNSKTAIAGITVNDDFTIATGTTFVAGAFTHSVYDDWNNYGTFTAGTSTIQFLGNHNTNINGATTFNILTVNNTTAATVVVLQSDISAATVNMTLGTMLTGTHTVTITVTRTGNGKIFGNIQRTHAFTTGVAYAFVSPNNTITFSSVSGVSSITVSVTQGTVTDFPFTSSVNEQYAIAIPAGTYNATLRLAYDDDELNGNVESTLTLWRYNGSSWVNLGKTGNDITSNYVEESGLTSITNRWTFANSTGANVVQWNGSVSTDWNTAANWTTLQGAPSRPPAATDIVDLGNATFTYQPTISSAVSVKNINFGSVQAVTLSMATGGSLTSTNIHGTWGSNVTHTINANNQSVTLDGKLTLSDGVSGHAINLNIGSGTVSVGDALTQSGGANIVFSGAGTLNIGGDYNYVSGTFTRGTGNVIYYGGENQVVGAVSYYNLTINKTAGLAAINNAVNVLGNLLVTGELDNYSTTAISGNVTINSGSTLTNNSEIHVGGNWANSGTFLAEGLGVFFDGSGTQNISASSFGNLNINKPAGTAILNGDLIISGNLIVTSGTLDFQTYFITRNTIGGFASIADGATGIIGGNNGPSGFATYTLGAASTVIYNGTSPQFISSAGISFGNLVFSNAGTKTLVTPLALNGNLTIDSGATLGASSYAITLNGNWINNGTFTPSTSTTLFTGTAKNISGNTTFNQAVVSGSYTILNNNTFNGLLNITSTGSLSGGGTISTTVNGDLLNSGVLYALGTTTFSGTALQTLSLINATTTVALTVNFNGSVSPVLNSTAAPQFGYININNTGGVNPSVGWTILYGLTVGSGASFNGGTSTHNFLGAVTNNGTITSNGMLNFIPSAATTVNLGSNFSSTDRVYFGGAGAMTLLGTPVSFRNVNITNTNAAGITPPTDWTLTKDLTVASGSILNAGNHTYSVARNISNSGTINSGTSTFILNGTGTQNIYTVSPLNNLTINNAAASTTLSSSVTVNGVLNFVSGKIQTGGNVLSQPTSGTVTGAAQNTGWLNGLLQKSIPTGTTSKTFEVGGPNNYTPVTVAFAGVTTAGDLTASVVSGDHASIGSAAINSAKSVNRNWTLTNNGIVFSSYDATFNFVASDVDTGANTSVFIIGKYSGGSWTYPTVGTRSSTTTQATGLTSFSDFQIGEPPTFVISGHIQNAGSVAVSGVTMSLSGGQSGSTVTDANGNYAFANLAAGFNYTVTPAKYNYAFSPVNLSYNNLTASQTAADFAATDFSGHAPALGGAQSFAVLAATTVTSTGLTVVNGNVGVSPGTAVTGFGPGVILNGAIYSGSGSLAGPAQASALTAYQDLVAQQCLPANNLTGKVLGVDAGAVTLGPGVYCFDANAVLATTLTLNDGGNPGALFIFRIGTTLTTGSNSQVVMSGGGRGANVYWALGTSATLGTDTAFRGNVIANTSITMTTRVSTTGRVIALNGAITMDTNNVNAVPATIPTPNVTLTASVSPTGTVRSRTDLVYTISFINNGASSASLFVITDPIPANTDFKIGSSTTSLGTTGLTPTLAYSNDGGTTWTYTPVSGAGGAPAGYDRSVTNVRWSFAPSLSQTSPNNTGSVTLTARIR